MTFLGSVLLYLVAPLTAVLAFLHHSAIREEAEKKKNKFNAEYKPDETDCTVELSFTKAGVDRVSLSLGPWSQFDCPWSCKFLLQARSFSSPSGFQDPSRS